MTWVEKHHPTPFDNQPIEGFFYLDGDALARLFERDWTAGQKYAMLAFPSGEEYALWESSRPEQTRDLALFGEMDLPLKATRDEALTIAEDIAEQCGYQVAPLGDDRLELIGHDTGEHLVATFDLETGRIADVALVREGARVAPLQMELLPDKFVNNCLHSMRTRKLGSKRRPWSSSSRRMPAGPGTPASSMAKTSSSAWSRDSRSSSVTFPWPNSGPSGARWACPSSAIVSSTREPA